MPSDNQPDAHGSEAKARHLVDYAREQAARSLQAQQVRGKHDLPDDLFPGYTILGNVNRGGQGRVYEAIDDSTQRRVAIKVMRSGPFGSDRERGRFEREIRVLAQLQHPNIVTIHSSGTVSLQRYLVMDFIDGQPLDEFVLGNHLTIEQTLDLFLRICEAVNAAHLRGIVHRDLKPGNIRIDDHGEPHVLDFGLAKAMPNPAGEATCSLDATVAGQFVGSLPWAAPEQLTNAPGAIDLRTDVYGLGLLLYFMLTQSFPFDRRANLHDLTDSILRAEPVSPRSLRRDIDDELDTIVLTCLHKEQERRYQIAGELARDIKRYRAGEPIEAKRDSTGYLLAKVIRRHRGLATVGVAFVLISVGYATTVSLLLQRARQSERLADQQAKEVRRQHEITRDTMSFLVNEVAGKLKRIPSNTRIRQEILEGTFDRLLPLVEEHGDDPQFRDDLMRAHYQLGDLAIALGRDAIARPHLEKAVELRLQTPPEELSAPDAQAELSINYVLLGDVAEHLGDSDTCEGYYRRALAIDEHLVADHPGNAHYQDNLAWSYDRLSELTRRRGNPETARQYATRQLAIMKHLVETEPENVTRLSGLRAAHRRLLSLGKHVGDTDSMDRHFERAMALSTRIIAAAPNDPFQLSEHIMLATHYYRDQSTLAIEERVEGILQVRPHVSTLLTLEPDVPRSRFVQIASSFRLMTCATAADDGIVASQAAADVIKGAEAYASLATPDYEVVSRHLGALVCLRDQSKSHGDAGEAENYHQRACAEISRALETGVDSTCARIEFLRVQLGAPNPPLELKAEITANAEQLRATLTSRDPKPLLLLGQLFAELGKCDVAIELIESADSELSARGEVLPDYAVRQLEACRLAASDK